MFNVFANVAVDFNPFRRDMRQVENEAERAGAQIEQRVGNRLTRGFRSLGGVFSGIWGGGTKAATSAFGQIESRSQKLGGMFGDLGKRFSGIFSGVAMGAGMAAFNGITGLASKAVAGFGQALFGLNNQSEGAQAKIMAFTKSAEQTAEILAMVRDRAAKTPFAFQEMADAAGSLIPVGRQAGISLEELMKQAEILAASNPMQGLEGASFSLREAMTGDFTSIIERFNLSRASINKWKDEGLSNFEIVQRAMAEMGYDSRLVAGMADTMAGRWSTFRDTIDTLLQRFTNPLFNVIKGWLTDVQKLADANTERLSALADVWGARLATGIGNAYNAAKAFLPVLVDFGYRGAAAVFRVVNPIIDLVDGLRGGSQLMVSSANNLDETWIRRGTQLRDVVLQVKGGFDQIRDVITAGDFRGGGPFAEDSPLITGLLRARDLLSEAIDRLDRLREKAGIPMPDISPAGLGIGAAGLGGAGLAAGAVGGIAGAGAGLAGLVPGLGMVGSLIGPLVSGMGSLAVAMGPVGLGLAALAVAAGGLYVAWNKNLFGLRDTTDQVVGFVRGKLDELGRATEPLRTEFLGFWEAELRPGLQGVAIAAEQAFNQIVGAVQDLANSQGVRTFKDGVSDLWSAAQPILRQLAGAMREDLGPAIMAVVGFAKTFTTEFGLTMSSIIRAAEPVFAFIGRGLAGLASLWREHGEEISAVVRGTWDVLSGIVRIGWEFISGVVVTGLRLLRGDWDGAWQEIRQTAYDIWEGIKQVVTGAWQVLSNTFSVWSSEIKDIAGKAWEWIRDRVDQLSGEIGRKLDSWSSGLATMLDNGALAIKNAVMKPWEQARDAIGGVMDAFKDKMLGPLRSAKDGMQTFVNGIGSAIKGLAGKLGVTIEIPAVQLPGFAGGYSGGAGRWAWVGEGADGRAPGSELAYLAPGSRVIPHADSMAMVSAGSVAPPTQRANLPGYAAGFNIPGLDGLMDFFGKAPEKIVQMALDAAGVKAPGLPGVLNGVGGKLMGTVTGWMVQKLKGWLSDVLPVGGDVLQKALAAAESALGMEYQWGGNGNPSYDCSGFANMVAARAGLGAGMPRVVSDIYSWVRKGRNPLFTFGFQNPENPDPRVQHMGVGIGLPGGGMRWFEAGGRVRLGNGASGIGETSDYWSAYGYPPALEGMPAGPASGAGGSAPWNQQAPAHVIKWLLAGLAAGGAPASWLTGADIIAYHESGYDPNAINLKDENAQRGNPSKGLMQVIGDHFLPGEDPYDPVTNVTAATRYIKRRYGDMYSVPGPKSVLAGGGYLPYASGGVIDEPVVGTGEDSGIQYLLGEAGREFVIPAAMLPKVIAYFAEAMYQNRFNAAHLIGLPLEMRRMIEAIARARVTEARTRRANQVNGGRIPGVPTGPGVGVGALGPLIAGGGNATGGVGVGALGPLVTGANPYGGYTPNDKPIEVMPVAPDGTPLGKAQGDSAPTGEAGVIARGVFEGLQLAETLLRGIFGGKAAGDPSTPGAADPNYVPNKEPVPTMPTDPAGLTVAQMLAPFMGNGGIFGPAGTAPVPGSAGHPLGTDKLPPWLQPQAGHPLGTDKLPPWLQPDAPHPLGTDKLPPWLQPHPLGTDQLPPWLWPADKPRPDLSVAAGGAGAGTFDVYLHHVWPDGQEIVDRVTDQPIALEQLMGAGVKIFAKAVKDEAR